MANAGARFGDRADRLKVDTLEYRQERAYYEDQAAATTALRFWKCRDCRKRGEVFGNGAQLLDERDHLLDLEGDIDQNSGVIAHPIGPDRPKRD